MEGRDNLYKNISKLLGDKFEILTTFSKSSLRTMSFNILVKKIDDDGSETIYCARIFSGYREYGISRNLRHIELFHTYLMTEIATIENAHFITDMAPRFICTVPPNRQEIVLSEDICIIVLVEHIPLSTPINLLDGDRCRNLKILHQVGNAILKLNTEEIFYKTFTPDCISICPDGFIKLNDIGCKSFEFEIVTGRGFQGDMFINECFYTLDRLKESSGQSIDAYAFGMCIFICLFGKYAIFPRLDEIGRAYGSRNPIPDGLIGEYIENRQRIWDSLSQLAKDLLGGLPDTYPCIESTSSPNWRFTRKIGFVEGTEFSGGLLCPNSIIRTSMNNALSLIYSLITELSEEANVQA